MTTDLEELDLEESTSDKDKVSREKKLRSANTKVIGALFNVSFNCDEAKAVSVNFAQLTIYKLDPSGNAFKL